MVLCFRCREGMGHGEPANQSGFVEEGAGHLPVNMTVAASVARPDSLPLAQGIKFGD